MKIQKLCEDTVILKKGTFKPGDGETCGTYSGYCSDGQKWNGFDCPKFEKDEVNKLVADLVKLGYDASFDDALDAVVVREPGYDSMVCHGSDCVTDDGTKHLYGVGDGVWTWYNTAREDASELEECDRIKGTFRPVALITEDVDPDDPGITDDGKTAVVDVAVTSMGDDAKPKTKEEALRIDNALTEKLDRALDSALYALEEENFHKNCNLLVEGLPGSSKTASITNWCRANNCNLYYLDAKNPDINVLISGGSAIDRSDPEKFSVKQAYSEALNKLDRPRSILFLDELNRQIKEYLRGSLLTLIADRRVAGTDEDGFRYFPELLFTIAAINPPHKNDRGAVKLSDAETRRFAYRVIFNSEVQTTKSYLKSFYDSQIRKWVAKHPEFTAADIDRLKSMCLRQWVGFKIIAGTKEHPFHYTTMDEYASSDEEGQITCQSTITDVVEESRGDKDRLIMAINDTSLKKSGKEMLINIINDLSWPDVDRLFAAKMAELGIKVPDATDLSAGPFEEEKPAADEDDDSELDWGDLEAAREDDEEMAGTADVDKTKLAGAKASDAEIEDRLKKFLGK